MRRSCSGWTSHAHAAREWLDNENWLAYYEFTWTWQLDWLMQPSVFGSVEMMVRREPSAARATVIRRCAVHDVDHFATAPI